MMNDQPDLGDFRGAARLFPLPNLVMFPNGVQALHVFEPRYRQMTADALVDDRLIAVVLLKPGWEDLYQGNPAIHRVACLGRVIADHQLPDGRYNILLRGLQRVRLRREINNEKMYRVAQAELLEDNPPEDIATASALRKELEETLLPRFKAHSSALTQIHDLFHGELVLGALCDVLAFALPFPPEMKQGLLEQLDVVRRARNLIDLIGGLTPDPAVVAAAANRKWPPDFSVN
jgi:Lon protease-like protein